jgi:beta-aspartyl-peptidase (threonine type)
MNEFNLTRRGWMAAALTATTIAGARWLRADEKPAGGKQFSLALHGGAGKSPANMSSDSAKAVEKSLGEALAIGEKILADGGTSLDAVERVVRFLEDDPLFNAGRGAVFNSAGQHELDASIMDGRTKSCGAVAAVRTVRHPISLSRLVMEKTRHVLLASDGAEKFADEMRVDRVENSWFDTQPRRKEWERDRAAGTGRQSSLPADAYYGTVGCVALDSHGNLAAGTSTGGLSNKKYGRVGDSPIVGAGTYADNATCAVSCTGIGEQFIRHAVAYDISARVSYLKQPLAEAVSDVLRKRLTAGDGGIIAVGADGAIVMDFSTARMNRAASNSSGRREVRIGR